MKKNLVLKIILIVFAVIILIVGIYITAVEVRASKIPHRYATAEEGRELLLKNTEYFAQYTQNDIDSRMKKAGSTMDEWLNGTVDGIGDFNLLEKFFIDMRLAKMQKIISKNNYNLPPLEEMVYIKADMGLEYGANGYTHGNEIYLNSATVTTFGLLAAIPGFGGMLDELIFHETFHCLTRNNPEFRENMYSLINFTVVEKDFEIPPCLQGKTLCNPDVEHHNSYATFVIDGKEIDCFLVRITTKDYSEVFDDFDSYNTVALVPIDGSDIYYTKDQASNYDEVFGTNTTYTVDPEECMADNFKYAMLYGTKGQLGKSYSNPEIIQGIIDYISK